MPARPNLAVAATVTPVDLNGPEGQTSERKRILLVEGDGFTRLVLLLRLRLAGFVVDFTSNGILGLGKLRHCRPDILLVELKLCGLSGLELIKAARAEATFGDRPIYVFTHAERMNRGTRKEVGALATEVLDKAAITREDLVQIFTGKFLPRGGSGVQLAGETQATGSAITEVVLPGAIEELVAGVREQAEVLANDSGDRVASAGELLSRVSSLASCANAAGLANLARQARALENFVSQLCNHPQSYTDSRLQAITVAVEVMTKLASETPRKGQLPTKFTSVFVDESPYSNRAMEEALLTAGFAPVCFEDPGRARQYLVAHRTHLVIANVALPEAHGLSVQDIRQIPAQVATPVLFAPDRTALPSSSEELPTSAPRMDKSPLLLAELVLRALNEVQSSAKAKPSRAPNAPAKAAPQVPKAEDGFNLFARANPSEEAAAICSPIQGVAAPVNPGNPRHLRFNDLFAAAGIPSEPIVRAEPELVQTDGEVPMEARLPEESPDLLQADEHALEAVPLANLVPEAEQPPQPAQNSDDVASSDWLATPAGEPESAASSGDSVAEFASTEPAALTQPVEPALNNGEIMNTQLLGLAEQRAQARCAELEQEVAALRQALEGLNGSFGEQQQNDAGASSQLLEELEQRLGQQTAELEQQKEQQKRLEEELRQQLEAKEAVSQQNEVARQQAQARCAELEQEVAKLRQAQEISAKAATDGDKAGIGSAKAKNNGAAAGDTWAGLPPGELEQQVRQGVAALARATAELAKERGERQRAQQLATDLNGRLQTLHQDFSRTLQVQGEHLSRITALEQEHGQAKQALEKCAADLEQHQAERGDAEEQLHKAKETNAQLRKDLAFFEEANKRSDAGRYELQTRLEASLKASRETETRLQQESAERKRLSESLEESRRELQEQARKHELVQQELKTANEALQDRETRLQKESAERQQLTEALESVQRGSRGNPDRDLEFSKVQSALQSEQVERQRQESQLARIRQSAVDASHAARAVRTGLRRQIREPVENLVHSTRSLLELEMGEEQKKLAEAVLQDVLLVQTRLREPGQAQPDANESNSHPTPSGT